ncbi:MAG: choice-of-anchor D domain-containing protein [Chromatiales bacterium]
MLSALPNSPSDAEFVAALRSIEGLDSDNDPTGSSNIIEIEANTQPGWAEGDNPQGVSGDLDPQTLAPDIAVSPLTIDYGAVTVDTTQTDSVVISNTGTDDLTVSNLSLYGSTEFSLPSSPGSLTIAPNASVEVVVEYTPVDEGQDSGTLDIESDSPGEELISVALAGTGVPVVVDECVASVDPTSIDFGSVEIGSSLSLFTSISNTGGADCTVDASVIDGGVFTPPRRAA